MAAASSQGLLLANSNYQAGGGGSTPWNTGPVSNNYQPQTNMSRDDYLVDLKKHFEGAATVMGVCALGLWQQPATVWLIVCCN